MRTRARLIATISVCFWLSLAAGNHLAANQRFHKPTEEDIQREKEMERIEQQIQESEKVLEKYRKQDEDLAKRIAVENEARRTRKNWGRLISGGLFVLLTLGFQMFKRQGRNPPKESSRSSQRDSSPRNPDHAKPRQSTSLPDWMRKSPDQSSQRSDREVAPRNHEDAGQSAEQQVGDH